MNLEKFGFKIKSNNKTPDISDQKKTKKERDNIYDKEKRERTFCESWLKSFSWLEYDEAKGKMYCVYFKAYPKIAGFNSFVEGSTSFHINSLKSHDTSKPHTTALLRYKSDEKCPSILVSPNPNTIDGAKGCEPLESHFQKLNDSEKNSMGNLFTIAHFIAKEGRPLSDMQSQCDLAGKLGVDIGKNYRNDLSARQFIECNSVNLIF